MRIVKKHHNKKNIFLVGVVVLFVVIAAAFTYIYAFNGNLFGWSAKKNSSINYDPPSKEEVSAGQDKKNDTVANTTPNQDSSSVKSSESTLPSANAPSSTVAAALISFTSVNQSEGSLQVRTLIDKVSNTGTCTIKLTRGAEIAYTTSAPIQALANSSTCKGFDIPTGEIATGSWTLVVEFVDQGMKSSASQEVKL
jgi:cytoskeletal protein RodZ